MKLKKSQCFKMLTDTDCVTLFTKYINKQADVARLTSSSAVLYFFKSFVDEFE